MSTMDAMGQPVTRGELKEILEEALRTQGEQFQVALRVQAEDVRQALQRLENKLDTRTEKLTTDIESGLEKLETKLLTAFADWARTHEARERGYLAHVQNSISQISAFDERLMTIEDRLAELERQFRQRPPQTN